MAQPTQVYPPWLTPIPETIYDPNGVPITTSTTILYLPLTYYGPSIPLGPYWTYGGLTPPVSTFTTTTTVIPTSLSTPTATPTPTSTPSPTSTTTTSSSSSSTTTSSSSSATITSTSTTSPSLPYVSSSSSSSPPPLSSSLPPTTATPSNKHGLLSRNQLIGVVIGAVIGALVILLAFLVCFLAFKNRRREQRIRFSNMPIDQDYIVVEGDVHTPGEGSPRHSGDERDSLLQAHRATRSVAGQPTVIPRSMPGPPPVAGPSQPAQQIPGELGARPGVPRVPVPVLSTYSSNNSGTSGSSTEMSSLGSIVPNSRLSALSPLVAEQRAAGTTHFRGAILSPEEQRRVEQETRSELAAVKEESRSDPDLRPLPPPPPRSVEPENAPPKLVQQGSNQPHIRTAFIPRTQASIKNHNSYVSSHRSSAQSDPDEAALLTARRVKPVDWGVRPAPYYYSPLSERPTAGSSGGIMSSISNRLSWFKNLDALPLPGSTRRRSVTPKSIMVSERDSEANKALLSPASDSSDPNSPTWAYHDGPSQTQLASTQPAARPRPGLRIGLGPEGKRPISGVSGRSGASSGAATTYFDAYSTFPDTPVLTPLPRAMTPTAGSLAAQSSRESNWRLPSPLGAGSTTSLQQTQRGLVEFGGRGDEAPPAYDENDTIAREHSRELACRREGVDVLDLPAPSALTIFRNAATLSPVGPVPISMMASTSTTLSNTNTVTSTTAPTLFTHTEATLSTATSESSLRKLANPKPDGPGGNSGAGTAPNINMVHVPLTGASVFSVKESNSWSDKSASGNNRAIQDGRSSHYRDAPSSPHFSSKETNRSNMTGTTLAADEKTSASSMDMLEDEPPVPGEGWRSLSTVAGGSAAAHLYGPERRFTLGWQLPQREITLAELGSLQAMRSHLSPVSSSRSTGSAPASRRDNSGSTGSRSSRPSAQHSLTHSGSISSSEGRRRYPSSLRYGGREGSNGSIGGSVSPALSAFGNRVRKQPSDENPRNLTPLLEQPGANSGSSFRAAPLAMGTRNPVTTTLRNPMSAQSTGAVPALMEIEEDVVEAAMRAAASTNNDREPRLLSPRSQRSDISGTFSVSSVPWATGLDQSWRPQ